MSHFEPQVSVMPSTTVPVASVRGVTHHYGSTLALDDITIDIPPGRMVGLIGPDGVGKSSLMGLIGESRRKSRREE